MTGPVVSN